MTYALKLKKPGLAPDYITARARGQIIQLGVEVLESGCLILGVSHGADDWPLKADEIRTIRETRASLSKAYAAAGQTLTYPSYP